MMNATSLLTGISAFKEQQLQRAEEAYIVICLCWQRLSLLMMIEATALNL